ncbi:MAG: metallophosphoesterase [Terriglobia bacterium]
MPLRKRRTRRRHQLQVTHQPIYLSRLPADFAGLRVVQLSDIHHGLYTRLEEVEKAVALANRLEPDLVALTGDFVSNSRHYIAPVARALGALRSPLGAFAVLGNHDYRVGADRVASALECQGIRVLRNEHVRVCRNGSGLVLAGVDDFSYGEDNLRLALHAAAPDSPWVLLSHNPAILPQAAACGVDLVLAGHTHGGQVALPRLRSFRPRRGLRRPLRFRNGWEQVGSTQIYISRGIGTVLLPLRVRCPAEIPLLRLQTSLGRGSGQGNGPGG